MRFSHVLSFFLAGCVLWSVGQQPTIFVPCPSTINYNTSVCVKVGFTYPANGSLAPEGNDMLQGYQLWAERANVNGIYQKLSNLTVYIQLMGYNDQSNSKRTNSSYVRLITVDQVNFLLGPYGTSFTQVSNAIANQYGKFIIFGSASGEDLFSQGYTNIFSVSTSTTQYTASVIPLLKASGVSTIAVALSNTSFTDDVLTGLLAQIAGTSLDILGPYFYPDTTSAGVMSVLPEISAQNPDAFFSFGLLADGPTVVAAAKNIGFRPKAFYLTSAPSDPQFVKTSGIDAEYLTGPAQWDVSLNYTGEVFGSAANFASIYQARFNLSNPSFTVVQAAASGVTLQLAIRGAASNNQSDVTASLRNLNFVSFYGPIAFDSAGRNYLKPMFTTQVQSGAIRVVGPSGFTDSSFVYPIPWQSLFPSSTQQTTNQPTSAVSSNPPSTSKSIPSSSQAASTSVNLQSSSNLASSSNAGTLSVSAASQPQLSSSKLTQVNATAAIIIAVLLAAAVIAILVVVAYFLHRRRKFHHLATEMEEK